MTKVKILILFFLFCHGSMKAQPTHVNNDPDRIIREVREMIANGQYAAAYPLVKSLKADFPLNRNNDKLYLFEEIRYCDVLCRLALDMEAAAVDAVSFIRDPGALPREQMMSFHLAHYYFKNEEYEEAIEYFSRAGYDNLSNEQIADAKFEKAYSHFNLKQFNEARPMFGEIYQMPEHKYYYPAAYYYGFVCYYQKNNDEALKAFRVVEDQPEYKGVVPYYITEIYYFQGKKQDALSYGEKTLNKGEEMFYADQLKLLMGKMYFEKQEFSKAIPLLEDYINKSPKVSREVIYEYSYACYKEGKSEKAMEGFRQLSNEKDSMGQHSMYLLGDLYLKAGQKENARNAFQYCAYNNSNPSQQKVSRFQYAKLSYDLGYQDVALKEMKEFLTAYPSSEYETEAREIMIGMLGSSNNYAEALKLYREVSKPTPAMQKVLPRILYGRAMELINEQRTAEAAALLEDVVKDANAGSVLPYAHFWLGELAYRNGRFNDALRNTNRFREAKPASQGEASMRSAAYTAGYSHYQLGQYKDAAAAFEQVAAKISGSSLPLEQDAYVRAGDCYYMLREYDRANAHYDQVIKAALPAADHASYQKAMIAGIKNSNEKIRLLNALQRQYPSSQLLQEANMEMAKTCLADEKFADAIPYLNKVLASGDESMKARAHLNLGLAYYNLNNNKEALTAFQKLTDNYPNSAETSEALAVIKEIYVEEGRSDDYVDLMKRKGISISVSEADSLSFAGGESKYISGDCAAAIKGLDNYLKAYAEGAYKLDALYMRSDCYRKNKEWQKALDGYKIINDKGPSRYFEKATLDAARICYFEQKDYKKARDYFESLSTLSSNPDYSLEASRGLVRSYYQLKDYSKANEAAKSLLANSGISTDDKAIGNLVLAKSLQVAGDCAAAIQSFNAAAAANRASWGAEARYEMAVCHFGNGNVSASEKAALSVIKETGAYDEWVTRAYILLGDIFLKQEDYFNAKATYESVARNASIQELKAEAQKKLEKALEAEKSKSKISNPQPK